MPECGHRLKAAKYGEKKIFVKNLPGLKTCFASNLPKLAFLIFNYGIINLKYCIFF